MVFSPLTKWDGSSKIRRVFFRSKGGLVKRPILGASKKLDGAHETGIYVLQKDIYV